MISFLLAMDRNQLIGIKNELPWHLPNDLRYFKKKTLGHPVVMGRKTFDSIGKPLPGRENIVLTHNPYFSEDHVTTFSSVDAFLKSGTAYGHEYFIIGGAGIFKAFLPFADRLYITHIDAEFEGDTYFTGFNSDEWRLVSRVPGVLDRKNIFPHEFDVYERT
ncbi:dihydrofolate reductase [Sporolactobacillus nakayamae]|uniref:Dihydrofolate reductase n=1 Tax=Sporolactobacillus nakayamae TaxID=269670 RepID=A0A1I2NAN0_9BACL|nr:dihydrofolate reductase [Sporolactobacillus nakayamae]SFF98566.1 dihydrofolate reductase [Sporolactobacillus nakayamae]